MKDASSESVAKGPLLEDRRWFRAVFAVAELLMAAGFIWAVLDGWDSLPPVVSSVFLAACCVTVACAACLLWERVRRRSVA